MKKILSIALAVLFALSVLAVANAVITSPTIEITFTTDKEGFVFAIDEEADVTEDLAKAAEDLDAFFGEAADAAKEITGNDELELCEFAGVIASGYEDEMGDVKVTAACPTAYEEGQKVAVLLGIDGEWTALEGVGAADNSVEFTLDAETAKAVSEAGNALFATAL